jgi:MOSC domain-containing protein YiiM
MARMPAIVSVNVGRAVPASWAAFGSTAIDKRPAAGRVPARALGLEGDEQANRAVHGGVDQAVYAYAREDLDWWEGLLGRELPAGRFAENLTTRGVELNDAVIGERWRVGTVEFEVSVPRIPCSVFQAFLAEKSWVKRFTQAGRAGTYLRVVGEGAVGAGDEIVLLSRPDHGITVGETFRALTTERDRLPRLLDAPQLPAEAHDKARQYLASRGAAGA